MPRAKSHVSFPLVIGIFSVLLVAIALFGIANRFTYPSTVATAPRSGPEDVKTLIHKVARHIVVKSDEAPSVATVQDPELLRKQSPVFYQDVQLGDRLLVWSDKAVLYSPTRDVILMVSPLVSPSSSATSTKETIHTEELASIEVRNGSGRSGMAKAVAEKLVNVGFRVLPPGDASTNISTTILVKSAGREFPQAIEKLKELLRAGVGELPQGEASTTADILVIIGANEAP